MDAAVWFFRPEEYFVQLLRAQAPLALPRIPAWRRLLGDGLLLMAKAVYGFDSQRDFDRARRTILAHERNVTGRAPRGQYPAGVFQYPAVIGKTDSAHNKSASGTVSIWTGSASASITDSNENITAYNRFANVSSGKWVICLTFPSGWEIISAEC